MNDTSINLSPSEWTEVRDEINEVEEVLVGEDI